MIKSVVIPVLSTSACFFGLFWICGGFESKSTPKKYDQNPDLVADEEVQVKVLKSDKEIIFFCPLPSWERDGKADKRIVDKVNEEAERWQKKNPDERVKEIKIEERNTPRMYSISLFFLSHKERYPWLP